MSSKVAPGGELAVQGMSLVDWMLPDVARFVYDDESLRRLAESDRRDSTIWSPGPFIPCQDRFENESRTALQRGDLRCALENYMYWLHNRVEFTQSMARMSGVFLLTSDELTKVASPSPEELSPYENDLLDVVRGSSPAVPDKDLAKWVAQVRRDQTVLRFYNQSAIQFEGPHGWPSLYDMHFAREATKRSLFPGPWNELRTSYEKRDRTANQQPLEEMRIYLRERNLFYTAARTSYSLEDPAEELTDLVSMYDRYPARSPAKLNNIKRILYLAAFLERDDVLNAWIDRYAAEQRSLDGTFYNTCLTLGWKKPRLYYETDAECGRGWHNDYDEANPLLVEIVKNSAPPFLGDDKHRELVRRLANKAPVSLDEMTRYRREWFKGAFEGGTFAKNDRKRLERFDTALLAANIRLEPSAPRQKRRASI